LQQDIGEKILEGSATSDKTTIVIERQPDGKMRVTSGSWDDEKVFLKDQGMSTGGSMSLTKPSAATIGTRPMSRHGPGALGDQAIDELKRRYRVVTALHPNVTALHPNVTACPPLGSWHQ
jgi:hypothetical protein